MSTVNVTISVDNAHLEQISEITKRLQSAGMSVEQTLPTIGVISGSIDSEEVNRLYQIEGVQTIEPQQSYRLPPPESEIQ
jgi:hypothetical protein